MKVVFHEDFYHVYTGDPASAQGRLEAVVDTIQSHVDFVSPDPATEAQISAIHTGLHMESVRQMGLYDIAALAAGGAVKTAEMSIDEPCFGLIRPPGHHASADSAWGFCYFNNMAIAVTALKRQHRIESAYILDIDLHYGDGNVNILGKQNFATICNPDAHDRDIYMEIITKEMDMCNADIIGVSAGFDNHSEDWGGLLSTEDYKVIAQKVRQAAIRNGGGCFGILEGGYNHQVLGKNVEAFLAGFSGG